MSAWSGKFVIGLTGNIATGKSIVRQMLQDLGAFGIDADALAHQVIAKGTPAYWQAIEEFGSAILDHDGEIVRSMLAKIVFSDPVALARLEAMIHPQVRSLVDTLVRGAVEHVVVIEAIKLIEAGYPQRCDSIWVTVAPIEVQLDRLIVQRGMTEEHARQRISAQPPQEEKIAYADVIINNIGSIDNTRRQVQRSWANLFPASHKDPEIGV